MHWLGRLRCWLGWHEPDLRQSVYEIHLDVVRTLCRRLGCRSILYWTPQEGWHER